LKKLLDKGLAQKPRLLELQRDPTSKESAAI
jgi:hypothetical protein